MEKIDILVKKVAICSTLSMQITSAWPWGALPSSSEQKVKFYIFSYTYEFCRWPPKKSESFGESSSILWVINSQITLSVLIQRKINFFKHEPSVITLTTFYMTTECLPYKPTETKTPSWQGETSASAEGASSAWAAEIPAEIIRIWKH